MNRTQQVQQTAVAIGRFYGISTKEISAIAIDKFITHLAIYRCVFSTFDADKIRGLAQANGLAVTSINMQAASQRRILIIINLAP